jgi:L-alanine-DL-glutamate epimerase-like enolase superfamily enzyme
MLRRIEYSLQYNAPHDSTAEHYQFMILNSLKNIDAPVDRIELYRVDVDKARHFSFGTWHNRQHAFLKISADGHAGWAEAICGKNEPQLDIAQWGQCFKELQGLSISQAIEHLVQMRDVWPIKELECAEMAVLDLAGRVKQTPTISLLGLQGREAIAGLFCVLEDDPQQAAEQARLSLEQNLKTHIKVKIFGNNDLDVRLVAAVREVMGPQAYVTADVNGGYAHTPGGSTKHLAKQLLNLRRAGLDACEDPAWLSNEEWVSLQSQIEDLALIADYPTRPSWGARQTLLPDMARIYNLHPASMGSLLEIPALAQRIQSFGAQLMIGDDSLIGPACPAWQQIAIGVGAAWVEALEKPQESDVFPRAARTATAQQSNGRFGVAGLQPGFGTQMDEELLRPESAAYCTL